MSTCYIFVYVAFLGFPLAESQARWSCYCRITGESFPRSGGLFYCMACSAGSHILYSPSAVSARRPSGPTSASRVQDFSPNASFAASPVFSLHPGPFFFFLHAPCRCRAAVACRDAVSCRGAAGIADGRAGPPPCFSLSTSRTGRAAAHVARCLHRWPPGARCSPAQRACAPGDSAGAASGACLGPRAGSGRAVRAALGQRRAAAPLPSPDRWSPSVRFVPTVGVPCCGCFVDAIWWTSLHVADSAPIYCSACGTSRCPTVSADGLTADIFFFLS